MKTKIKLIVDFLRHEKSDFKLVIVNSSWLVFDKISRVGIGIFISAWMARYLGPAQFGEITFAIAFLAIFQTFSLLGLDAIVVSRLSRDPGSASKILGTSIVLRFIASITSLLSAIAAVAILYNSQMITLILVCVIGVGMVFQITDVIDLWFQSQSKSKLTILAKTSSFILISIIKAALIIMSAPLWMFGLAQGGEAILAAIGLALVYRRYAKLRSWEWDADLGRDLLKKSYPILIAGLLTAIYMKSSQIIIKSALSEKSVGIYSSAQMLSEVWYFLPAIVITSVAPMVARGKIISIETYNRILSNIFSIMWIFSIAFSILIAFGSSLMVKIVFGNAYNEAGNVLAIHIFTLIPVSMGMAQTLWIINEDKIHLAFYQALFGAISAVLLNYLLIKEYGIIGGACATLIAQLVQAFVVTLIFEKKLFYFQIESLFKFLKYKNIKI